MIPFSEVIAMAWKYRYSDLHFKAGIGIYHRKAGRVFKNAEIPVPPEEIGELLLSTLSADQKALLEKHRKVDYSIEPLPEVRCRGNVFYQSGKLAAVFRLVPTTIPTVEELGLPPLVKDFAMRPRGLVLIAGPGGSGKTTSAAAMVQVVNLATRRHIITIEDPVEYIFKDAKSVVTQREVGSSTRSFAMGLKASLREDPEVIFVGEMRDLETFSTAITMSETGHLVISTVQSIGACETIDRIVNIFPPSQQEQIRMQLSLNIQGIISQMLLPMGENSNQMVAAIEVLNPTFALRALIRKGEINKLKGAMETSSRDGNVTMRMAIEALHRDKKITEATMKGALAYLR